MKKTTTTKPPPTPIAPPPRRYTLWITRDSDPVTGVPFQHVRAWFVKPRRLPNGAGALWCSPGGLEDRAAIWSLAVCRQHARTVPDDDRMCIRIEGDCVRGEERAA